MTAGRWVEPINETHLKHAIAALGRGGEAAVLRQKDGLPRLVRLRLLGLALADPYLLSRAVIRDRRGCILEPADRLLRAVARAPIHTAEPLENALTAVREKIRAKSTRPKVRHSAERAAA
jgi:hypothetical protein